MADYRVEILPEAWEDLDGIGDYYMAMVGAEAAERVTDQMLDDIDALAKFPLMAPPHPDPELAVKGYRKLVLTKTYVAVYKVEDDMVFVYRIVNGTTDYPKLLK